MIRIIFDNGELLDCENVSKIYVEESEMDNLTIVGNIKHLEAYDERLSNMGSGEA